MVTNGSRVSGVELRTQRFGVRGLRAHRLRTALVKATTDAQRRDTRTRTAYASRMYTLLH
jgi:hypothetical protein